MARYFLPATVPPAERVAMLDLLAAEGCRDPRVRELARRIDAGAPEPRTGAQRVQHLMDAIPDLLTFEHGPDFEMFPSVDEALFGGRGEGVSRYTGQPRGAGRCSARTAVFIALACVLGFPAKARWFQQDGAPRNHVAAWVCDGTTATAHLGGCFLAEVTVEGARLGEGPYEAMARTGRGRRQVFG